jgi:RNA polymerase sigma factor (sigma-70 family)
MADRELERASMNPVGGASGDTGARRGDVDRQRLVETHLRLVTRVAREFQIPDGMEFVDASQHGVLGLLRAAERFDPSSGVPFAAYAMWWIRSACLKGIHDQGRVIRLPSHVHGRLSALRRTRRELGQLRGGSAPSDRELAEKLGIDCGQLAFLQEVDATTLVVEWVDETGGEVKNLDGIPQSTFERPDDASAREELAANLRSVVARLTERQRFILTRRFGLDGDL